MSLLDDRPTAEDPGAIPSGVAAGRPADVPKRLRQWRRADLAELGGSAVASLALTWLLFFQLTALYGTPGFVLVATVLFVAIYWYVEQPHGSLVARDRVASVVLTIVGLITIAPLIWIITTVIIKGLSFLRWNFFVEDMSTTGPQDGASSGGAAHSIIGSLQQVAIAMFFAVPIGVMTAVYLNEVKGRLSRIVRAFVDAMSGLPSIVAGLFIYAVLVLQPLEWGYSGFAAGMALMILMLPSVTRTSEEMLRLVPDGLREASLALGAPQWRTALLVVLPTARVGLITAVILGMARAIGETAPVLLTAFGNPGTQLNPFDGPQDDLPLYIYSQVRSSIDNQVNRGWTGALVLVALVLVLFTLARLLGGRGGPKAKGGAGRGRWLRVVSYRRRPEPVLPAPGAGQATVDLDPPTEAGPP